MSLKLHSVIGSPNCSHIHAVLFHLDIEHEYVYTDLFKGEAKPEEYLKLNPIHQIPTLEDGEVGIGESTAILRYILKKYPNEDFYPTEGQAGATQDFVHTFEQSTLRKAVLGLFFGLIVGPKFFGKEKIEGDVLKQKHEDFEEALVKLEKFLKGFGGEYLTGSTFTLADLTIFTTLFHLINQKIVNLDEKPELKAWYERSAEQKGAKEIVEKIADAWN